MTSDKEMASRIRNFLKECNDLRKELQDRGYKVSAIPSPTEFSATKIEEVKL